MKNNTQQNTKIVKGDIFDYWTVIDATILKIKSEAGRTNYFVTCQCKCGTINKVRTTALLTNKSKGCRCRSTDKPSNFFIGRYLMLLKYLWRAVSISYIKPASSLSRKFVQKCLHGKDRTHLQHL